jgi:hypothetical protein
LGPAEAAKVVVVVAFAAGTITAGVLAAAAAGNRGEPAVILTLDVMPVLVPRVPRPAGGWLPQRSHGLRSFWSWASVSVFVFAMSPSSGVVGFMVDRP